MTRNNNSRHGNPCTASRCPNKEHESRINSIHDRIALAIDFSASGAIDAIESASRLISQRFLLMLQHQHNDSRQAIVSSKSERDYKSQTYEDLDGARKGLSHCLPCIIILARLFE